MLSRTLERLGTSQLLVAASFLAAMGLVMVYSASALRAELFFGSSTHFVVRQLGALFVGVVFAAAIARMPQEWLQRASYPVWAFATLFVFAALGPFGISGNGARRWVALGPVTFQPLEVAKLGVVLATASWLSERQSRMDDARVSIGGPLVLAGIPAIGLLLQPDFGGALLVLVFTGVLIFAAGARLDHLGAAALVSVPALVGIAFSAGYRVDRMRAFLNPFSDEFGSGFQLVQSLVAFGAGGLAGTGLGAGQQKLGYLPEAHTDFILSVVGEEVGLVGVSAVLVLFAVTGLASIGIAMRARNTFALLIALGGSLLLWVQGLINAGVSLGVLPTTGATLPLFSYGRNSLVATLAALGLVLNAARPKRRGRSGWRS